MGVISKGGIRGGGGGGAGERKGPVVLASTVILMDQDEYQNTILQFLQKLSDP